MKVARSLLMLAVVVLAGCAQPDTDLEYVRERDSWTPLYSYVPEVQRVQEARGFCVSADIRGDDFVFSRTAKHASSDEAATLAAAGLFQPVQTTPELQNAQRGAPGHWYRITDLGRKYHQGGGVWCFGRRADITVMSAGTPVRLGYGIIQRIVTYSYRAVDMPEFSQTEAFRKAFPAAPANGAILTDTIKLTFGWKGVWDLPQEEPMLET